MSNSAFSTNGGGGSGTVSEIDTGVGLQGGPITTTGTINLNIKNMVAGRLSLFDGDPVRPEDVVGATVLYYTPYFGNDIALYSGAGSIWNYVQTAQISIAVPAVANQMYDVFIYYDAGNAVLELQAWTNDTTRSVQLVSQDGVLVKDGFPTRRYMGSFRTDAAMQANDSLLSRTLWNYYNRVSRNGAIEVSSFHTYNSATVRQWNADAAAKINFVVGLQEDRYALSFTTNVNIANNGAIAQVGFGLDSTSLFSNSATYAANFTGGTLNIWMPSAIGIQILPSEGFHFVSLNEAAGAGVVSTFGDPSTTDLAIFTFFA